MKLLDQIIQLPTAYSVTSEATSYVAGLMMEAEGIPLPPTDAQGQQHAVIMGREMRKHLSEVEMTRKLLVGPLNETTSKINEISKVHCQPLRDMLAKIEDGVNQYQLTEQKRIEQEELARQAEIDRLAQLRLQAEQKVEDVPVSGDDAMDDIAKATAEAELEAAEAKERALIVALPPLPTKAVGAATGQKMVIEVTNLDALFKARPDLCRIEANLKVIREKCFVGMQIPGLKLTEITKTTIRK